MKRLIPFFLFFLTTAAWAQKKPLDHTVYDSWQSIGERMVSNDGRYIACTVVPQEGDGELRIMTPDGSYQKTIARGYNAVITEDSRYLIFRIKPFFQDTRQARIKKKKPDETPKDSAGILVLGTDSLVKYARVKSVKSIEKGSGWIAMHLEKTPADTSRKKAPAQDSMRLQTDRLVKLADSVIRKSLEDVKGKVSNEEVIAAAQKAAKEIIKKGNDEDASTDADGDDASGGAGVEGTDLLVRNLITGKEKTFKQVSEFLFDKPGNNLLVETTKNAKDSNSKALVLLYRLATDKTDTLLRGCNDCKGYAFDETGGQLAFVAERDSSSKALQKFYKLWYYKTGNDTAMVLASKNTVGMKLGSSISENATPQFSKDGGKLFFGTAPIKPAKDTTLVDFELAKVDVWHYNDDYLQTVQLKRLDAELKRSYLAVTEPGSDKIIQLGADDAEDITIVNEGNANWVLAESDKGQRISSQWEGRSKRTAYIINTSTGQRTLVGKNMIANFTASPAGRFVYWYDAEKKHYFAYEVTTGKTRNISTPITTPLYDEENDVPYYPGPYGVMGWASGDSTVYIYDRYNYFLILLDGIQVPYGITWERKNKITVRYVNTNREERFVPTERVVCFRLFYNTNKQVALTTGMVNNFKYSATGSDVAISGIQRAKNADTYIYTMESYTNSPNLYTSNSSMLVNRLTNINQQQSQYNWGTAELTKWKAYNGKETEGIIYKPENFNPAKKYPLICYFYETLSDGLNSYIPPAPTPSRLNISFFVSRGYIVLAPDIHYTTGHPGNDAYNHIVSGARHLVKLGYVDSNRIGIQGQSWGGYQVAHLITRTKLFKAAWAGAPVVNMTSAYGGIRWESGFNRQFQYEHGQSRIGSNLWQSQKLYLENSPLFYLDKCTTPIAIMSNDADGAVPWYQGIEMFTALRRLGKPVWLLNYNNEAHNLLERRNRKDIQIREQQFFDWLLKGDKPANWLKQGVPATQKGIDWGLKVE